MPASTHTGIRIVGIAAVVPPQEVEVQGQSQTGVDLGKVIANTGVKCRRIAAPEVCTSDLCAKAAERLFEGLQCERGTVDLLLFVSQTPDYVLPATACSLHGRLGLGKSCAAFDMNLGCSGYVYALSLAAAYLQAGAASRVLLLVGDTISKLTSPEDRSVAYLFGDAGSATLLERNDNAAPMHFVTGSDGSGAEHLKVEAGMFRHRSSEATRTATPRDGGNIRSDEQLAMNGPEIFNFTLREIPGLVSETLKRAGWNLEDVDAFVMHQANRFMLDYLGKRMKLPAGKAVVALENFGNTSSASIPLAICDRLRARLEAGPARLLLAGFGVGFSWAAAAIEVDRPVIMPVSVY